MKKWQIVTSIAVALVAVLSLSVAAFAQGPQPPADAPQYGRGMMRQGVFGNASAAQAPGPGYGFRFGVNGESLVDITAQVANISVQDVVQELQSGKTFADVAKAHGKTAADLVNAFLADRKATLDKAVADGRITRDIADTMLETMKANVEQHVNSTWQPRGMGYRFTGQQPLFQRLGPRWNP